MLRYNPLNVKSDKLRLFSRHAPALVAIIGPTAAGKSNLAMVLAKLFHGAIISADSQQLYRHAAIGTNQPVGNWRQQRSFGRSYVVKNIPHFFIDKLLPNSRYSAAQFQQAANRLFSRLHAAGYLPILVGGTPLYVSAIIDGYRFPAGKPNPELRKSLEQFTTRTLLQKLKRIDTVTWHTIDRSNRRRVIRALEYILATDSPFIAAQKRTPRPNTLIIGLNPDKLKLRQAIVQRTKHMLVSGLIAETKYLQQHYPGSHLLQAIGYRETVDHIKGKADRAETEHLIATHTWQYARRQMTWFKRLSNVYWVHNRRQTKRLVSMFLKNT